MAFFARSCHGADTGFTPLFRLLDDFESYSRDGRVNQAGNRRHRQHIRTFNPRFDVRETDTSYELHGELPGVQRENLHIEFTDPQTIVISGRVERNYTAGTATTEAVPAEAAEDEYVNVDEGDSTPAVPAERNTSPSRQATVSNEEDESATEQGASTPAATPGTEVTKPVENEKQQPTKPADKYWLTERSIGEFTRTFSFSNRVEQESVAANLNNGILSVSVPKAKKHEARTIAIN